MSSLALLAQQPSDELSEICRRLRDMGYAESKRIRIYGQEFEVVSNPFPQDRGIAVRAVALRETQARVLQLPLPVLQTVTRTTVARKKTA